MAVDGAAIAALPGVPRTEGGHATRSMAVRMAGPAGDALRPASRRPRVPGRIVRADPGAGRRVPWRAVSPARHGSRRAGRRQVRACPRGPGDLLDADPAGAAASHTAPRRARWRRPGMSLSSVDSGRTLHRKSRKPSTRRRTRQRVHIGASRSTCHEKLRPGARRCAHIEASDPPGHYAKRQPWTGRSRRGGPCPAPGQACGAAEAADPAP